MVGDRTIGRKLVFGAQIKNTNFVYSFFTGHEPFTYKLMACLEGNGKKKV